jgi:tRNA uridine 5-carbamoylmethylation protein Kti12
MEKNENTQPTLIVLVGLPASGKSFSRAHQITQDAGADSFQYSTDDAVERLAAAAGATYDDVWSGYVKQATAEADKAVAEAIKCNQGVIWDQTNMSDKKRGSIVNRFGKAYYKKCICILPPFTAEQHVDHAHRLQSRSGKNIPDFVMRNMRQSFVLPSKDEGFDLVLYFDIYGTQVEQAQAEELFGSTT